jgi:hypothetical protein
MLSRLRLSPLRLPLHLYPRFPLPLQRLKSRPSVPQPSLRLTPAQRRQARCVFQRGARQATRTLPRQLLPCPPAAWSCPKPDPARSTRRPMRLKPYPSQALEIWLPAFNAASRSSTAGPLAALAPIPNARREALQDSIRPELAHVPSIRPAPRREATPDQAALPPPEPVPVLAHGPALERPVRAALAAHPVLAALRPQARRLVRSERHPAEAAADDRSTPRPKKAR